ncbi:hypothetical protein [Nioella aestuarii]|uniref:hypothetical protein n=1 Tax=Nioella aestuarii TaxID=1662864 RepID=UPI003D7F3785
MKISDIASISDAQKFILDLYPNDNRDFSYVFGYATRHLGYLCKSLCKNSPSVEEFIRSISWLLALANKLEVDVEVSLIKRHPDICPYCVVAPCKCRWTGKKPAIGIKAYKIPEELFYRAEQIKREKKADFQSHCERLAIIYPGNAYKWDAIGPWQLTSKMQEELAEVHEAATRYLSGRKSIDAVAEEFADLFAWLLSAWGLSFPEGNVDDSFIEYYLAGCPVCGNNENCECELFADLSTQLVDSDKIKELEKLFLALSSEVGFDGDEVSEVLQSLEAASKSQSEPVARAAVDQAKAKTEELEKLVERGAKNAKNATTIAQAIYKAIENFPFVG